MHEFWYVGKTEVRSGERREESKETAWGQTTQNHVGDFKKLEIILRWTRDYSPLESFCFVIPSNTWHGIWRNVELYDLFITFCDAQE